MYNRLKSSVKKMLENLPIVIGTFFIFFIGMITWQYLSVYLVIFGKEDKDDSFGSGLLFAARISVLSNFFYFVMESLRPYFRVILTNLGG